MRNNTELQHKVMARPRTNTSAMVTEWLERRLGDACSLFFIIAEKSGDLPCGYIQLVNIDFMDGTGELGILLDDDFQGRGYGSEALRLFEEYVQKELSLRKVILKVLAHRNNVIAFYERSGYSRVGFYTRHHRQQGKYLDVMMMEKHL